MTAALARTCEHPGARRRRNPDDPELQVCLDCGEGWPIGQYRPADLAPVTPDQVSNVPARQGNGLRFIDPTHVLPGQVEREILDCLDRMESGAEFQSTKEGELGQAKLEFDLAFMRAVHGSTARSEGSRKAEATLACEPLYRQLALLEQTVRTAREQNHHLRSKLSGLQTIARSVGAVLSGGRP